MFNLSSQNLIYPHVKNLFKPFHYVAQQLLEVQIQFYYRYFLFYTYFYLLDLNISYPLLSNICIFDSLHLNLNLLLHLHLHKQRSINLLRQHSLIIKKPSPLHYRGARLSSSSIFTAEISPSNSDIQWGFSYSSRLVRRNETIP